MVRNAQLHAEPDPAGPQSTDRFADEATAPGYSGSLVGSVPPGTLYQDETILLLVKPSILFVFITSFRFVVVVLLLALLVVHLGLPISSKSVSMGASLVVLGRLIWALLVWTSHIYILTEQRIITIKGIINVAIFQATLRKIQRTSLYKPLYLRIFGLGTIGFATAAAVTSYDSTWLMIPHPEQTHQRIVAAIHRMQ